MFKTIPSSSLTQGEVKYLDRILATYVNYPRYREVDDLVYGGRCSEPITRTPLTKESVDLQLNEVIFYVSGNSWKAETYDKGVIVGQFARVLCNAHGRTYLGHPYKRRLLKQNEHHKLPLLLRLKDWWYRNVWHRSPRWMWAKIATRRKVPRRHQQ